MDEEELNGVANNSQAKQTKKATQWAVTVVTGWLQKISLYFQYSNNKQQQFKPKLWCWEQMLWMHTSLQIPP